MTRALACALLRLALRRAERAVDGAFDRERSRAIDRLRAALELLS